MTIGKKVLPFSSAAIAGNLVFISGQGGLNPDTGEVVGKTLEEQTVRTMLNIQRILEENNLNFSHVKKANIYLANREDYTEFNRIYSQFVTEPFPARTTIYCDLNYDLLVEIDVIAASERGGGEEWISSM